MEILFDTADIEAIETMTPIYPMSGVTTNPTIIKAEGPIDFYPHFRRIRSIIGRERTLHVQVLARDADGIIADAHRLLDQ
ncbi:MAG TPA: transaldolase family protein, partial [Actinoplanes sp.]|nr:transaldolase family protein [Actinoplanes sp.]